MVIETLYYNSVKLPKISLEGRKILYFKGISLEMRTLMITVTIKATMMIDDE